MLLVLPPSETKRDGGASDSVLDLSALGFEELAAPRRGARAALARLSRSVSGSMAGLGLGVTQRDEIDRNRAIRSSPTMPALQRYTGVVYDGLDYPSMSAEQRVFAAQHVAVHSALFGLLRADDPIPAYRLSHDSRLPGLKLRTHWRGPISSALASRNTLVLDLRSEAYTALGPTPEGSWYLRVVSEDEAGRRVALSHFNKKAKGEFTRAVVEAGIAHDTIDSLLQWARSRGIQLEFGAPGEVELVLRSH